MAKRASTRDAGAIGSAPIAKRTSRAKPAKPAASPPRKPAKATSDDPAKAIVKNDAKPSPPKKPSLAKKKPAVAKALAGKSVAAKPSDAKPSAIKPSRGAAAKPNSPTRKAKEAPATPPRVETTASPKAKQAPRSSKTGHDAAASPPKVEAKRKPEAPRYLAAELGQPVDHEGEPVGAGSARARSDDELQRYSLQLWRQMQTGRVTARYTRAIEKAGLTIDEVWTAGLVEVRATSSTPEEMRRYRQKLLFRANLLEAILTETIADLHRLDNVEPTVPAAGPA